MARTRSTRKTPRSSARSPRRTSSSRTSRKTTTGRAAPKGSTRGKTTRTGRGAKTSEDSEFREEVEDLLEKLTSARRPWSLRRARQEFERSYVNHIIRRSDMDRQRAAKRLDIGFSTLKEKIRKPGKR